MGLQAFNMATLAELILIPLDSSKDPEIRIVPRSDASDVDGMIDLARAESRKGEVREVMACVDSLPVARFAAYIWRTEGATRDGD